MVSPVLFRQRNPSREPHFRLRSWLWRAYRLGVTSYLLVSASVLISVLTAFPTMGVVAVWLAPMVKAAIRRGGPPSLAGEASRTTFGHALLLLGTGYCVAGQASSSVLTFIVVYWAGLLYETRRRPA